MHKSRRRSIAGVLVALAILSAWLVSPAVAGEKTTEMVAMRDGVKLATDVYLPEGDGPWPVVLLRTPYNKNSMNGDAHNEQGYAVVIQDVRGRFESGGFDNVFADDGWNVRLDGYDTVEWVAAQPWCTGKIGTLGGSALAITQYLMACTAPPNLTCQVAVVGAADFYHQTTYQGGVFRESMMVGWTNLQKTSYRVPVWLSHPNYDSFWVNYDCTLRYPLATAPCVHVGGWYDIFTQGTIDSFVGLQSDGGKGARGTQKLIMGPWTHGVGKRRQGQLEYPENSVFDLGTYEQRWFKHWLKGEDSGIMDEPAVNYYAMGDVDDPSAPGNEWRTAESWPPESAVTPYYLRADGLLSTAKAGTELPDAFRFDPGDPVPTEGGQNLLIPSGPMDQRALAERDDVLKYVTDVLAQPVEVTGHIYAELWASSNVRDTDWTMKLVDIYPDGREMLVTDGIIRSRFRNTFREPMLMQPGAIYQFRVDLWSTSLVFNKGHRIGIHVSSSNSPRFQVNPNNGEPQGSGTGQLIATNTVYHDKDHPSHILLPVVVPGK